MYLINLKRFEFRVSVGENSTKTDILQISGGGFFTEVFVSGF